MPQFGPQLPQFRPQLPWLSPHLAPGLQGRGGNQTMAPSLAREADIVALANDIGAGLDAE
jgi:hypothetical protein